VAKLGGWKNTAMLFRTYGHALDDATVTDRIAGDFSNATNTQRAKLGGNTG
jgi:hypothetical protein